MLADLRGSSQPLVVSGFASLDELIDLVASLPAGHASCRLLFGWEPFRGRREDYRLDADPFPKKVEDYWLSRGVSLLLSAKLIAFIEKLETGDVEARYLVESGDRLHAKIFIGDEGVTLGSSNFTRPGLDSQLEANVRFSRKRESKRYAETRDIAENFWQLGRDYREALIELLNKLLRLVTWQEALARACAELLEGEWAKQYMSEDALIGASSLWPSQRQGIARALYILDRQGSVLVADATGSGKTRMGAHLVRAVTNWMLRSGQLRYGRALMVCPPSVSASWERERFQGGAQLDIHSHGTLSHGGSTRHDLVVESLRQAQILCVDEGHNFLNVTSNRTRQLLRNMADHVILFTATPINRSVLDLLRIADMLGADNLQASTLAAFKKMLGARQLDRTLTDEERDSLRTEIRRFTLRRTKRELNKLIAEEPSAYRDARGNPCRFPKHRAQIYNLGESEADRKAAAEIRELAGQLNAVTHFRKALELPDVLRRDGWTEEKYLAGRLESARKLARYMVMASLRSSRAALIQHIEGTANAKRLVKLTSYRRSTESGHMLGILENIAGQPPQSRLSVKLPDWLTDADAHQRACQRDRGIYARILKLVACMSDGREQSKVKHLLELIEKHGLVLAFDSRPITLAFIAQAIGARHSDVKTLVATGDRGSQRTPLLDAFAPGAEATDIIGLCSDSLSEGVNLQQASCMVHLDMPSVVRIAEQRVGRIDRMDSPHREIEAWWPEDAPEFALAADEKFIERFETVERLLGSNLPLPEQMQSKRQQVVRAKDMIAEFEKEAGRAEWDGIEDAFESVRDLVTEPTSVVSEDVYTHYRNVTGRLLSRVSLVRARRPWAFFCLGSGRGGAPRWILLTDETSPPLADLDLICASLRERLGDSTEDLQMDGRASRVLERFISRLGDAERVLLPRRKQRALDEMEYVLERYVKLALDAGERKRAENYGALQRLLAESHPERQPDWDEVAARWLDLIRPVWYDRLKAKRKKPLLLKDIRRDLISKEAELGPLCIERFHSFPIVPSTDVRIRVCILGVN